MPPVEEPPLRLLISFAPEDRDLKDQLIQHLQVLERFAGLKLWEADRIRPGDTTLQAFDAALDQADVALMLISPDFLASDLLQDVEVPKLFQRHEQGGLKVIPVLLRSCCWEAHPWLGTLNPLPTSDEAIASFEGDRRDRALTEVVREIVGLAAKVTGSTIENQRVNSPQRNAIAANVTDGSRGAFRTSGTSQAATGTVPTYPDAETRLLSEKLVTTQARKRRLQEHGANTAEVEQEILDLKRRLREGGQLKPGDSLGDGRYLLLDVLGRGGFATVWRAHDATRNEVVAIKVLHSNLTGDRVRLDRFKRGARIMQKLKQEAVVRVLEPYGEDGGWHYFVMEYLPGGDLRQAVLQTRLEQSKIVLLITQVCEAVAAAHSQSIIHRDIKPANILLDERGRPKLTDFDLAAAADTTGGTRTGAMGTIMYTAPELLKHPTDARSNADVYSLGMTTLFCLYGHDLPMEVLREPEVVFDSIFLTDSLKEVLARAISWNWRERYPDAGEFRDALMEAAINPNMVGTATVPTSEEFVGDEAAYPPRLAETQHLSEPPELHAGIEYKRMHNSRFGLAVGKNAPRMQQRFRGAVPENVVDPVYLVLDFEGQDLSGQDFSGKVLRGANFRRANLTGATLIGADVRGAKFVGAKLLRADLRRALFEGADLSDADLSWANLIEADLTAAKLVDTQLRRTKLLGAKLPRLVEKEALGAALTADEALPMWAARARVLTLALSPDGMLLATGHAYGAVWLWDVATEVPLRMLEGHEGRVLSIAWSADGRMLASSSSDKTVRLWEGGTGKALRVLGGHEGGVLSIAWSADGMTLASGSRDKTVRLWQGSTGTMLRVLNGHKGPVQSVAWSANGTMLASGSDDRRVRLWDGSTGKVLRVLKGHEGPVQSVAWSADGTMLASGSDDRTVRLWDGSTGKELRVLKGHEGRVLSVAWSANGVILASGSDDMVLRTWDGSTGMALGGNAGHDSGIHSVTWSADGETLVSGSQEKVWLWHRSNGNTLRALKAILERVCGVAWSADGVTLASGSDDKSVRLWHGSTGKELGVLRGHQGWVQCVAWSADGTMLASGSDDKTVRLWEGIKELGVLKGHDGCIRSVAWSADGRTLASGSDDHTIRLWDGKTGETQRVLKGHDGCVHSVAWSADGRTLASGSDDHAIRLWDGSTGETPRVLNGHHGCVRSVAWSADGKMLASGSDDKTLRLWEGNTGKELGVLKGHEGRVLSVAWSADGEILASGSADNTVQLWEGSTGKELGVLNGHQAEVVSVAFHPDGRTLASTSSDGTIRLWNVAIQRCLAILLALPEGWVAFTPDGRYKFGGNLAGNFWHAVHLCRFEPGELGPYVPGLRLEEDKPLLTATPRSPGFP
ncbi:protein kinase [Sorangium sp. So ce726]|uniref:WD40 domain-containing protein n=1 Tax=Sorangium sp. So ce726 TaxID=3133319 RepID=UPI003F5E1998